jgi:hypothetical protein
MYKVILCLKISILLLVVRISGDPAFSFTLDTNV